MNSCSTFAIMENYRVRRKNQRLPIPDFEALKLDTNVSACTSTWNAFSFPFYYFEQEYLPQDGVKVSIQYRKQHSGNAEIVHRWNSSYKVDLRGGMKGLRHTVPTIVGLVLENRVCGANVANGDRRLVFTATIRVGRRTYSVGKSTTDPLSLSSMTK